MKNILICSLTLILITSLSCKKDKLDDIEQIEFGYYNFAWGADCQRFELTPEQLSTTSMSCDPRDTATLVYDVLLSKEKFALAERLLKDLPESIFNTTETNFETACADCGEYYLRIKKAGVVKSLDFPGTLNEDWPRAARKTYLLLANTVSDLR